MVQPTIDGSQIGYTFGLDFDRNHRVYVLEAGHVAARQIYKKRWVGKIEQDEAEEIIEILRLRKEPRPITLIYRRWGFGADDPDILVQEHYVPGRPPKVWLTPLEKRREPYERQKPATKRTEWCWYYRASLGYPYEVPFEGTNTTDPEQALETTTIPALAFTHLLPFPTLLKRSRGRENIRALLAFSKQSSEDYYSVLGNPGRVLGKNPYLGEDLDLLLELLEEGALTYVFLQLQHVKHALEEGRVTELVRALEEVRFDVFVPDEALFLAFFREAARVGVHHPVVSELARHGVAAGYDITRAVPLRKLETELDPMILLSLGASGGVLRKGRARTIPYRLMQSLSRRAGMAYIDPTFSPVAIEAVVEVAHGEGVCLTVGRIAESKDIAALKKALEDVSPATLQRLGELLVQNKVALTWKDEPTSSCTEGSFSPTPSWLVYDVYAFAEFLLENMPYPESLFEAYLRAKNCCRDITTQTVQAFLAEADRLGVERGIVARALLGAEARMTKSVRKKLEQVAKRKSADLQPPLYQTH